MAETKSEEKTKWSDEVEKEEELNKQMKQVGISNENTFKPSVSDLDKGVTVEVQQDDPNSPLYSATSFEELKLSKELLDAVFEMGFKKPSKIQEKALPLILSNKNLIGQSQSGTGKTAAFVLGMLSKCQPATVPQAICVCPTRELARQILDVVKNMAQFTQLKALLVAKDEKINKRVNAQIIVGTPGKVIDLIEEGLLDTKNVRIFVLDEADHMIDREALGEQTKKIKRFLPKTCQYLLFSATFKDGVREYATHFVPPPRAEIVLKKEELSLDGIQQLYIDCGTEDKKFGVLEEIYSYLTIGQSIIFATTRNTVHYLWEQMNKKGHLVEMLQSDIDSKRRDEIIDKFRAGKIKVLVATNVLARGIDILGVTLVINYELPVNKHEKIDYETYLHRVGRSGRFGRRGIAINLVHDQTSKSNIALLEKHFGRAIDPFPADKLDSLGPMLEQVIDTNQREALQRAEEEKKREEEEAKNKKPPAQAQNQAQGKIQISLDGGKREIKQV